MRRWGLHCFTLLALFAFAGCRETGWQKGGTPIARRVQSVASLNPGASEILRSRTPITTFVGRTAHCNWPSVETKVAVIMNGVKPNYEKIAQLRPGMVVYDELLFSENDIAKIKQLGIETFAIKGDTVEAFIECLYDLGRELHAESSVMEYIDEIDSARTTAAGNPPAKKLRVAILMPGNGAEHMIAGANSLVANAVRAAQGEPVGPNSNRFEPVSAEGLVTLDPDLIICSSDPKPILQDPRLQSLTAIKNGKVGQFKEPDVLLRRGGRLDKLIRQLHDFFVASARS